MRERDEPSRISTDPNADVVLIRALQALADLVRKRYPDASDLIEQAALIVENARKPISYDYYKQ